MSKKRILLVTQELTPYTQETEISTLLEYLPAKLNEAGYDIRILMPCFGVINERRHKLHEVVRLSGMNIIVGDDDYPLIIKVASLPNSRLQVYFLDNIEFFKRKFVFKGEDGNFFDDNAERTIFFNKSSIEIVRKFGWTPDLVITCGWMTGLIPYYLKTTYKNDPIFKNSKVISVVTNNESDKQLIDKMPVFASQNQVTDVDFKHFLNNGIFDFSMGLSKYSDAVIIGSEDMDEATDEAIKAKNKNVYNVHGEQTFLLQTLTAISKFLK